MAQILISQETQKRLIEERTELKKQNFYLINNLKSLQIEYDSIAYVTYQLTSKLETLERKFEITAQENIRLNEENTKLREGVEKYIRFAKLKDKQYDDLKKKTTPRCGSIVTMDGLTERPLTTQFWLLALCVPGVMHLLRRITQQ
jgi:cell division protein FtsB